MQFWLGTSFGICIGMAVAYVAIMWAVSMQRGEDAAERQRRRLDPYRVTRKCDEYL